MPWTLGIASRVVIRDPTSLAKPALDSTVEVVGEELGVVPVRVVDR
jgi:hypothetical protein